MDSLKSFYNIEDNKEIGFDVLNASSHNKATYTRKLQKGHFFINTNVNIMVKIIKKKIYQFF